MNLDSLFHRILLTEQQLTEQTQHFKEVKVAIIQCKEKIESTTEKYEKTREELDEKAQQLSVMRLQHDLMKKRKEQMFRQIQELLGHRSRLRERLAKIKTQAKEEEERFLRDVSSFNSDFSLRGNRETAFQSHTHTQILDLERDAESLHKEMEAMSGGNSHMMALQEEKRSLQLQLQDLKNHRKELDQQLKVSEAATRSLRAQSQRVASKPLSDATCLRLRQELDMYKNTQLDLRRETLSSQIQLLLSKVEESGQGRGRSQEDPHAFLFGKGNAKRQREENE